MATYVGQRLKRKEDPRLLTGAGRFVGDLQIRGLVEVAVLRSTQPHARIRGVDVSKALGKPGVVAVYTGADFDGKIKPFERLDHEETIVDQASTIRPRVKRFRRPVLAHGAVYRVGEPIAIVVAESRYVAEDARDLIEVDYDVLPLAADADAALRPGAPSVGVEMQSYVLGSDLPDNVQSEFRVDVGDVDRAFREATLTFSERFRIPRQVASPMETRAIVAEWDRHGDQLTVWATTQLPHLLRSRLAEMLGLVEENIHVIGGDMGGSFGGGVWNEDIAVPFIARDLRRPVRWIEDRAENLLNARHSRDQVHDVDVAYEADGRITAIRDKIVLDGGVYNTSPMTCIYNTAAHLRGQFKIDNYRVDGVTVFTNKTPNTPLRGAGRQEAVFVMDRVLDLVAARLKLDPADVRRRNLIPASAMPCDLGMYYRDGRKLIYDSGDFPSQLEDALQRSDYAGFRARQVKWRAEGRRIGIGVSSYLEGTGAGPHEGALIRVDPSGHVFVYSGCKSHGQSLETTLAQVCADGLGVNPSQVTVTTGDTRFIPFGGGTAASRSGVTAGTAVGGAAQRLREKVLTVAAGLLEAHRDDLEMVEGRISPRGAPSRSVTLADVAHAAMPGPRSRLPAGVEPGLEAEYYFVTPAVTFASGTHVVTVEVDEETGFIEILSYVIAHDCGRALNLNVVEGQIHGAVAHGIGGALYEEVVYDDNGQLLTGTFMDYLLPTAAEVPRVELSHQECLSTLNPLGIKGIGEGGVASPPAAIANAVVDALRPLEVNVTELPLTPERLLVLIQDAKRRAAGADAGAGR